MVIFTSRLDPRTIANLIVVKQRMQIKSQYKNIFTCAATIYRTEGLRAFYISYPVTLIMSVPFQMIQFTTYEYARKLLNPSGSYNPLSHCIAGGIAGAAASFTTHPLDIAKTALQTRGISSDSALRHVTGLQQTIQLIYQKHGMIGFTHGLQARMLSHIPSTAVAWTIVSPKLIIV